MGIFIDEMGKFELFDVKKKRYLKIFRKIVSKLELKIMIIKEIREMIVDGEKGNKKEDEIMGVKELFGECVYYLM
jgi:hypothetical protein